MRFGLQGTRPRPTDAHIADEVVPRHADLIHDALDLGTQGDTPGKPIKQLLFVKLDHEIHPFFIKLSTTLLLF